MRLIHLSDIHFSSGSSWDPDDDQRAELLSDIRQVVGDEIVDGILVGGDIAFSGSPAEYEIATGWLEQVREACSCPEGAIWVVPGNHDIDRNRHRANLARQAMVSALRKEDRNVVDLRLRGWLVAGDGMLDCLDAYNQFAQQWLCPTGAASPHWTDLTLGIDDLSVCLTGLNSVLVSDTVDDPQYGPVLRMGAQQCTIERKPDTVHVVFGHHPPSWIRDWPEVEPYLRRAHVVLFGHEHTFRTEQAAPGQTLTIYAGAVAPERGQPRSEEFVAAWNLLTISRSGADELLVEIDPRTWDRDGTCFTRHPDGVLTRTVRLDLTAVDEATPQSEDRTTEVPVSEVSGRSELLDASSGVQGANSSPLIPGPMEVDAGMVLPDLAERAQLRQAVVRFMRLTPTRRLQIAEELGLADGLTGLDLDAAELGREILRRIRDAGKVDRLIESIS